jgi:hypothetical protein
LFANAAAAGAVFACFFELFGLLDLGDFSLGDLGDCFPSFEDTSWEPFSCEPISPISLAAAISS